LGDLLGISPAVIVSDSFGRAWRRGTVNVAIGSDGLPALIDMRGLQDRYGRILRSSEVAFADSLAAAAGIVMGEAQESTPVVMVQGARWSAADADASCLIRPLSEDLFQ
jgi:coenzyme F420-0:L-glutamate ligase/coenzyme F420-1:gamma-L-glutamate ligase